MFTPQELDTILAITYRLNDIKGTEAAAIAILQQKVQTVRNSLNESKPSIVKKVAEKTEEVKK